MNLEEYCASLPYDKRFKIAIKLCRRALRIWEKYCETNSLDYTDTVVGMHHEVRSELLSDTIEFCSAAESENVPGPPVVSVKYKKLVDEFSDPVTALQDGDWSLPYPVERTFYAVYNLLQSLYKEKTAFLQQTHYLVINQAADALVEAGILTMSEAAGEIFE